MQTPKLNLIGAGRLGQTLAHLFHTQGIFAVQDVLTRAEASAQAAVQFIGAGRPCRDLAAMANADIWLLAVPDTQISPMALALSLALAAPPSPSANTRTSSTRGCLPAPMALHCSGALGSEQLAPLRQIGWQVASVHPLLSFADPATALQQFAGTPCAIEGDASALPLLQHAFTAIGGKCFSIAAEHKLRYHAGAVFATNFLPVLQDVAERLWRSCGMPETLIAQLRATLPINAANNVAALGPQAALTGPAARGDTALVAAQSQALAAWDRDAAESYAALSRLASALSRRDRGQTNG